MGQELKSKTIWVDISPFEEYKRFVGQTFSSIEFKGKTVYVLSLQSALDLIAEISQNEGLSKKLFELMLYLLNHESGDYAEPNPYVYEVLS